MNYFSSWNDAIVASLQDLWAQFVGFIPELVGALLVLIVGLIIASFLGRAVKKVIQFAQIDTLSEKSGLTTSFEKVGLKFIPSGIFGWITKWFLIIAVLIAVADILKWPQVTEFLNSVALYIPRVFVAVIILIIGVLAGHFIHEVIQKGLQASNVAATQSKLLASIGKWAVIVFALMAALIELNIASRLIETLFTGVVAGLAIGFGLAFGLGGKEKAAKWLGKIDKEIIND